MAVKPAGRTGPVYRAVLVISIDTQRPAKIRQLASRLRCQPGVRQVDAVVFRNWRSEPRREAPWKPHGAIVHVEASDEKALREKIVPGLWREVLRAVKTDPDFMEMDSIDMW